MEPRFTDDTTLRLYDRALRDQWDAEASINWAQLKFSDVPRHIRAAMYDVYHYLHHSEHAGIALCARMMEAVDEGVLRDFVRVQVGDETRHTYFFARACAELSGDPRDQPACIRELFAGTFHLKSAVELFAFGQVIETAAQALFSHTARRSRLLTASSIRLPGHNAIATLIDVLCERVAKDEARHIAFGRRYLAEQVATLTTGERIELARQTRLWCRLFDASFTELRPSLDVLRLDTSQVLEAVDHAQERWMGAVGLTEDA